MSSVLTVNPMQTTNARGTFYTKSDGLIQGVALDDPAARYALASGTLANSETRPLWGGVAVNELVLASPRRRVAQPLSGRPRSLNWWGSRCSTKRTTA